MTNPFLNHLCQHQTLDRTHMQSLETKNQASALSSLREGSSKRNNPTFQFRIQTINNRANIRAKCCNLSCRRLKTICTSFGKSEKLGFLIIIFPLRKKAVAHSSEGDKTLMNNPYFSTCSCLNVTNNTVILLWERFGHDCCVSMIMKKEAACIDWVAEGHSIILFIFLLASEQWKRSTSQMVSFPLPLIDNYRSLKKGLGNSMWFWRNDIRRQNWQKESTSH